MRYDEFVRRYDLKLNSQQERAVGSVEGSVLLLAVPGSGKTTVLVSRLGYMIYCLDIEPESILTMTYTVAATHDMRDRFISFFGDEYADRLEFRTINGVCQRIIGIYERLNNTKAFEVLSNEAEITKLLSAIYREVEGEFPTESDIKNVRAYITYAKNMMLDEARINELCEDIAFGDIYKRYNDTLRARALMDYDDQMVYAYRILKRYPVVLGEVRSRYRYICVDEAQDTSKIQHEIIKLISSGNLFMVGDEDQSIYGFRAAYPEALLNFEKDHPESTILLMEENYRCDANVVEHADRFIKKNKYRHPKSMKAVRPAVTKVKQINFTSRISQYNYLLKVAQNTDRETAILYRDNESMLPFIDLFERNGISYRTRLADLAFFTHKVVQDIRDIIAFAYDPYDREIFMRIYYKLSTYLTKDLAQSACQVSRQRGIPILTAALDYLPLHMGTKKAVKSVQTHFEGMLREKAGNAVYRISRYMGYGDYLDRMSVKNGKLTILEAIGNNIPTPKGLITRLDELRDILKGERQSSNIILSTIHSAKGLEYDTVYLIDVCDGVFPESIVDNYRYAEEEEIKAYEEERRLFYVAVTRARNRLNIFSYSSAHSTFTEEFFEREEINVDEYSSFETGGSITHRVFGKGRILSRDGELITVRFENGDIKKLSLKILTEQGLI